MIAEQIPPPLQAEGGPPGLGPPGAALFLRFGGLCTPPSLLLHPRGEGSLEMGLWKSFGLGLSFPETGGPTEGLVGLPCEAVTCFTAFSSRAEAHCVCSGAAHGVTRGDASSPLFRSRPNSLEVTELLGTVCLVVAGRVCAAGAVVWLLGRCRAPLTRRQVALRGEKEKTVLFNGGGV